MIHFCPKIHCVNLFVFITLKIGIFQTKAVFEEKEHKEDDHVVDLNNNSVNVSTFDVMTYEKNFIFFPNLSCFKCVS